MTTDKPPTSPQSSPLSSRVCEACRADAPMVPDADISTLLAEIPEWQLSEVNEIKQLVRCYDIKPYSKALDFVQRIGELADSENHHPEILLEWGKVTVKWWTHKIKGLHLNDFIMAARCDELLL